MTTPQTPHEWHATTPRVHTAATATALARLIDRYPGAVVISADLAAVDARRRAWWPLLDLCTDDSLAAIIAEHLVGALPDELDTVAPEAATVLTGALHAAALVGWPPVTVTHILDAGAIATITELCSADGDTDLAVCVAAAGGDLAVDAPRVRHAAAVAARPLLAGAAAITGPPHPDVPGTRMWREVRGAHGTSVIVATGDVLGQIIADRLTHLDTTADAAASPATTTTRPGTPT